MIPRKRDHVSRILLQSETKIFRELQNDIFHRKILNCMHLLLRFFLCVLQC